MATEENSHTGQSQIHDDILETILSHTPLVDLVSARHVSRQWNDAVSSTLQHRNKPKPWLFLHIQSTRFPNRIKTRAYDPRSRTWLGIISEPSIRHDHPFSTVRSSHSNFLYYLTPSRFSFSTDPLNATWHHVDPPLVWRTDPVVARVGEYIVVAGGGFDFENDPFAVEIYYPNRRVWETCHSMPAALRESSASTWLSVATSPDKLVVTERQTGSTYWFDPASKSWSERVNLDPGQPVSTYCVGWASFGLILAGLCRSEDADKVKIWRVGEDFSVICEIGEMPSEYVKGLLGCGNDEDRDCNNNNNIDIRVAGDFLYVYGVEWEVEVVVGCEFVGNDRSCRWWRVENVVAREDVIGERLVYTCAEVGVEVWIRLCFKRTGDLRWSNNRTQK